MREQHLMLLVRMNEFEDGMNSSALERGLFELFESSHDKYLFISEKYCRMWSTEDVVISIGVYVHLPLAIRYKLQQSVDHHSNGYPVPAANIFVLFAKKCQSVISFGKAVHLAVPTIQLP